MPKERKAIVAVVGDGGSGFAVAAAYGRSSEVGEIHAIGASETIKFNCPPGFKIYPYPEISVVDSKTITQLCLEKRVDLIDLTREESLLNRVSDSLRAQRLDVVGANFKEAQIEISKISGRDFMQRAGLPIPEFTVSNQKDAPQLESYLKSRDGQLLFFKADLPARGKGVVSARTYPQYLQAIDYLASLPGNAGFNFLIEEAVGGSKAEEFSTFYGVSVGESQFLGHALDWKRAYDGDLGENTGSQGSLSPTKLINPVLHAQLEREIVHPTTKQLLKKNMDYRGVMYFSLMSDPENQKIWVIEINARWGDSEGQVVVPSIKSDILDLGMRIAKGLLPGIEFEKDSQTRLDVPIVGADYPKPMDYLKGREIHGIWELLHKEKVAAYLNGLNFDSETNKFYVKSPGRMIHIVSEADNVSDARSLAYGAVSRVYIPSDRPNQNLVRHRNDIGLREQTR